MFNAHLKIAFVTPLLAFCPLALEAGAEPWKSHAISLESGLVWQAGSSTPLSYRLVPTQLSWRSPEVIGIGFRDGSRLLVRHRATALGAWIEQGPESYYVAIGGSPSVEWWNVSGTWSLFGGAGGGVGLTDSRGVEGGQGQDFTLHWFARAGMEHAFAPDASLTAGVMFLHMSNGGQTDPNPGIDAVGFTIGYSRKL